MTISTALQSDPKWRKYSQLVEKTLQSFEQILDWADFLTFLAKLLKVGQRLNDSKLTGTDVRAPQCLQGFPQYQVVPHKLTVAKRLSQCLNPALPTGVHQRALDVYTHILTTIGVSRIIYQGVSALCSAPRSRRTFEETFLHGHPGSFHFSNMQQHQSR